MLSIRGVDTMVTSDSPTGRRGFSIAKRNLFLVSGTMLWLLSVGAGIAALWQYSLSPGTRGEPPHEWPSSSAIRPEPDQFTLVVVVHPHCVCSRATIGELA